MWPLDYLMNIQWPPPPDLFNEQWTLKKQPKAFLVVQPHYVDARLDAQQSFFTIAQNPLEPCPSTAEWIFPISKDAERKKLLGELYLLGKSHSTLYPGLGGLAKDLSEGTAYF